jgi:alkaline phosphatase D
MSTCLRTNTLGVLICLIMSPRSAIPADPAPWPDPVANDVVPSETAGITHGPHLGAVTADSARVWVRTAKPIEFSVVLDDRLPLTGQSRRFKAATTKEQDHCGVVDLSGLAAATRYFYGIEIDGVLADSRVDFHDPWPSFRTLPDASTCRDDLNNPRGLFNVCFSVACCGCQDPTHSGGQYGSTPAFDTLLRTHGAEPMFHIFNGDTIYEELRDGTLDGVRNNYKLYYSRGRSLTRLLRSTPGFFLYNDHEIGNDIQGSGAVGTGAGPQLLRDVALRAWTEYCGWANPPQPQRGGLRFGNARVLAGKDVLEDVDADFTTLRLETISTLHVDPFVFQRPRVTRHVPARNAGVYGVLEVLDQHRLRVTPAWSHDEQVAYSIGTHHYYDWTVGNCHFFALDTRGERSRLNTTDVHDPASFILGPAQKKWLIDKVRSTTADFVFVISPDPWVIPSHRLPRRPNCQGPGGQGRRLRLVCSRTGRAARVLRLDRQAGADFQRRRT